MVERLAVEGGESLRYRQEDTGRKIQAGETACPTTGLLLLTGSVIHRALMRILNTVYTTAAGQTINGTRVGLGPDFANDDYDSSIGNSNFNSLQTSLRHTRKTYNYSIEYTYSKAIDQASSISDPVNPL